MPLNANMRRLVTSPDRAAFMMDELVCLDGMIGFRARADGRDRGEYRSFSLKARYRRPGIRRYPGRYGESGRRGSIRASIYPPQKANCPFNRPFLWRAGG